jgi:hypothetical protein
MIVNYQIIEAAIDRVRSARFWLPAFESEFVALMQVADEDYDRRSIEAAFVSFFERRGRGRISPARWNEIFNRARAAKPSKSVIPSRTNGYNEIVPTKSLPPAPEPAAPPEIIEKISPPPPPGVPEIEAQPSLPHIVRKSVADIHASNLQTALELAGAGVPIFPARVDWEDGKWKKKPIITGWQLGSADPERVRAWWRQHPDAVPGIALGRADLVVIDADRHGGPDGVAAFEQLAVDHGLPVGPVTRTAGGGLHFIFRQPDGKPLGNREGVLAGQGINIRGRGGWIVAPGAVRPDGEMWSPTDGSPSLAEAFRNGTIPTIPTWIVDLIRAPKPVTPKETAKKSEAKTMPEAALSSGKPSRNMDRRGRAWAATILKNRAAELAAKPPRSGRNELANALAFQMGTMVARGWIDRNTVFNVVWEACGRNGLAVEEPQRTRDTIERAIADGMLQPHPDLADGRSRAGRSGKHDAAWRKLRCTEVYRALCVRPDGKYATMAAAADVLNGLEDLDRWELGRRINLTFDEYKAIGARFGRHPSTIAPCDATQAQMDAHLALVREAKKPARAEAERARRLRKKLEREQQPQTNDLLAQRCAGIVGYARKHPGKHCTGDLVRGLKRTSGFEDITDKTRRNVIDGLLKLATEGKLPAITEYLIVTKDTAKNRKNTFTVEYRK